jgi:hypothetical protein
LLKRELNNRGYGAIHYSQVELDLTQADLWNALLLRATRRSVAIDEGIAFVKAQIMETDTCACIFPNSLHDGRPEAIENFGRAV